MDPHPRETHCSPLRPVWQEDWSTLCFQGLTHVSRVQTESEAPPHTAMSVAAPQTVEASVSEGEAEHKDQ